MKGIIAAKKKQILTVPKDSLGVTVEPTQRIEKIYVPTKTKKTEFLTGPPKEMAAKLVQKLKVERRVIDHETTSNYGTAAGKVEQHQF